MTRDEHEQFIVAHVERIETDLLQVLEHHTRLDGGPDDKPRYSRHVALHSVIDLAGRLMLSMLQEEGDAARPLLVAMVQQLDLLITPRSSYH